MQQYDKAVALHAWAAKKRSRAVEMRLHAVSVRLFAQAMRGERDHLLPVAPLPIGTPIERHRDRAVVTEQAKGILAARLGCSPDAALVLICEYSSRMKQPPDVFARQVVGNRGL